MGQKTKKTNPNASDVINAIEFQQCLERLGSMLESASVKVNQILSDVEKKELTNINYA